MNSWHCLLAVLLVVLMGCTSPEMSAGETSSANRLDSLDTPRFVGRWAREGSVAHLDLHEDTTFRLYVGTGTALGSWTFVSMSDASFLQLKIENWQEQPFNERRATLLADATVRYRIQSDPNRLPTVFTLSDGFSDKAGVTHELSWLEGELTFDAIAPGFFIGAQRDPLPPFHQHAAYLTITDDNEWSLNVTESDVTGVVARSGFAGALANVSFDPFDTTRSRGTLTFTFDESGEVSSAVQFRRHTSDYARIVTFSPSPGANDLQPFTAKLIEFKAFTETQTH